MQSSLLVTTVPKPTNNQLQQAQQLADELEAAFLPRNGTLRSMQQQHGYSEVLTVGDRLSLFRDGQEIFFHPSMAAVRVKRLIAGDTDVLVEKSGLQPGDAVLDCTLGLGSDAIVFAHVVGDKGNVTGIEQSKLLSVLVREGLQSWESDIVELNQAMRRVNVISAHHMQYLKKLPDHSFDIVYFDPMFRATVTESTNIGPLRTLSLGDPLSPEAIKQAQRVARKTVILKERPGSGEFARLGFPPPVRRSSAFTYSFMQADGEGSE